MPSIETTFCWATPVKSQVLGAHLEAYIDCLPMFTALRLCHRFGKGSDVHINKLPVEVIVAIEEILTAVAREKFRKHWVDECKCHEQRCRPSDHLSHDESDFIWELWRMHEECEDDFDSDDFEGLFEAQSELFEQRLDEEEACDWRKRHETHHNAWSAAIDSEDGFFAKHNDLFRKHFGLEVWVTRVRTERDFVYDGNEPKETTAAYLKLSNNRNRFNHWETDGCEGYAHIHTSGYSMVVQKLEHRSEEVMQKFRRTMKKLALKTNTEAASKMLFEKGTQPGLPRTKKGLKFPQPTILTRCLG